MPVHVEHLTSNARRAWPLSENATGLATDLDEANSKIPRDFMVDAVFQGPAGSRLWLSHLTKGAGSDTITFSDVDGPKLAFSIPKTLSSVYVTREAVNTSARLAGRLVIHQRTLRTFIDMAADMAFGTTLPVSEAAVKVAPREVQTLQIIESYAQGLLDLPGDIDGDVVLVPGYNMLLDRENNGYRIHAIPASGDGQYPCSAQVAELETRDIVPDEHGNLEIPSSDCYEVETYPELDPPSIMIHHLCDPCCDCEDYIDFGEKINVAAAEVQALYLMMQSLSDQLTASIDAWNTAVSTRPGGGPGGFAPAPKVQLEVVGGRGRSDYGGYILALVINPTCSSVILTSATCDVEGITFRRSLFLYENTVSQLAGKFPFELPAGKMVGIYWEFDNPYTASLSGSVTVTPVGTESITV